MRKFLALLLLLASTMAQAQVPSNCRPAKLADVRLVSAGADFAGWWWCDSTRATYAWRGVLRPTITSDHVALAYAWAVSGDQRLFEQVNTLQETDPKLAALKAAVVADVAANQPRYVVAKNGTYPDRPAYPVVDGVRGKTSTARATVGSLCSCSTLSILEGSTRYCLVAPATVAVCVPAP